MTLNMKVIQKQGLIGTTENKEVMHSVITAALIYYLTISMII